MAGLWERGQWQRERSYSLNLSFPVACLFVFVALPAMCGMQDLSSLTRD